MKKTSKTKMNNWVTGITVTILAGSALSKIFQMEMVAQGLYKVGVGKFMILLGVVELSLALLFISSRNLKLSFILLSCFFSGAIATEITHGGNFVIPAMFVTLVWIATFLRDPLLVKFDENKDKRDRNPWNVQWNLE